MFKLKVAFAILTCMLPQLVLAENLNGWDYLVKNLIATKKVNPKEVRKVFADQRMPKFELVTFRLKPSESYDIYSAFYSKTNLLLAQKFIKEYHHILTAAGKRFDIEPSAMVGILLVETKFGSYTGESMVLNRLARVSNVIEPNNLQRNYELMRKNDPNVTFAQVEARARYLQDTFLPEIVALFEIARKNKLNIFNIKGSIAGAFGLPQFLPSSYLKFAVDGDRNGKVSLFEVPDAIYSVANYLSHHGWIRNASSEAKRQAIWAYNHSNPYIDTVWKIHNHFKSHFR